MALEILEYENGYREPKIVVCPACGHDFAVNESRWRHFLEDHGPEDFGLSPIGECDEAAQGPMFARVEDLPVPASSERTEPADGTTVVKAGGGRGGA